MRTRYVRIALTYLLVLASLGPLVSAANNLLNIRVIVPATASPGDTISIFLEATFNGTYVNAAGWGVRVWFNDGGQIKNDSLQYPQFLAMGRFYTNYTIPDNATGLYWIQARGTYRGFGATGVAGVTIAQPNTDTQLQTRLVRRLNSQVINLTAMVKSLSYDLSTLTYFATAAFVASVALGILAVAISVRNSFTKRSGRNSTNDASAVTEPKLF